jgi:hypothetical protein
MQNLFFRSFAQDLPCPTHKQTRRPVFCTCHTLHNMGQPHSSWVPLHFTADSPGARMLHPMHMTSQPLLIVSTPRPAVATSFSNDETLWF